MMSTEAVSASLESVAAPAAKVQPRFPEPITGIVGPPGSGKTHLAATCIPEFNAAVKARKPHVPSIDVNDVWWLQFDRAGTDTVRSYGVNVKFKDLSTRISAGVDIAGQSADAAFADLTAARLAWLRNVASTIRAMREAAKVRDCRLIVVDSLTAMMKAITDSYTLEELLVSKFDRYAAYRKANTQIKHLLGELCDISVSQIWLLHARTAWTNSTSEMKDDQTRRPVPHTMELDIQQELQGFIEPLTSMMLGASVTYEEGKGTQYQLITKPDGKFPIKNRWAARMPADNKPDLQRIWDIVAAVNGEQK